MAGHESDYDLETTYLSTRDTSLLADIADKPWVARAALETLLTVDSDAPHLDLLDVALQATAQPAQDPNDVLLRQTLLDIQQRAACYQKLLEPKSSDALRQDAEEAHPAEDESGWDLDDDDDDQDVLHHEPEASTSKLQLDSPFPFTWSEFLRCDIIEPALHFAQQPDVQSLTMLLQYFSFATDAFLRILDALPYSADPLDIIQLLSQAQEGPSHRTQDWSSDASHVPPPLSQQQLSHWYLNRAKLLDADAGLPDMALLLVQHVASRGIQGLDELGEDLSLLCKLVYDAPEPQSPRSFDASGQDDWTLQRWHAAPPASIFAAYLAHSTPSTVISDIRRLALPYAYVLEAKAERAGQLQSETANIPADMLLHWLFACVAESKPVRMDVVAAVIQGSKPDLPQAQRIIKEDVQLARVALACVYGCPALDVWSDVSKILDCLPALESAAEQPLSHLQLVSTASPTPAELYRTLLDMSRADLSRAMDALDVHLEQAETLARWHNPVRLSWFSQHAQDASAQRSLATKVAQSACRASQRREDWMENQDDWEALMEDLLRMARPEKDVEEDLLPAFGQLGRQELMHMFFKALLSSGSVSIAKSLFNPSTGSRPLEPALQEQICLETSRELYDNADSANLHQQGDMKSAYDCLSIAPQTPDIRKEREFLEATSRLASYRLQRDGLPLTPIQIRLTKDKLTLIQQVLHTSDDARRHPDLLLDLLAKLGHRGDKLAEIKTLALVVDAQLRSPEQAQALDVTQRIVQMTEAMRSPRLDAYNEAAVLAWNVCYSTATRCASVSAQQQLDLLGQALLLCPTTEVSKLLTAWRDAEEALQKQPKKPQPSTIDTSPSLMSDKALSLGHAASAAASTYLGGRPVSPANLSPSVALDSIVYGREGGVREKLQSGMSSGLRWLVEG